MPDDRTSKHSYKPEKVVVKDVVVNRKVRKSTSSIIKKSATRLNSMRKGVNRGIGKGLGALGSVFLDSPSASSMPFLPFVFCLFFVACVFGYVLFDADLSFSILLEKVSWVSGEGFNLAWISELSNAMKITSDWGIFDFLKDFINLFTSILAFGLGLIAGLLQLVQFVFGFIRMLM